MKRPNTRRNLDIAIERLCKSQKDAVQLRRYLANIVVAQMLPECVIKGGSSLKIRYGDAASRYSMDLDTALRKTLDDFIDELNNNLKSGWEGFTGFIVTLSPARPNNVPEEYVMQPFEIKLQYMGRPWITIPLEVGYNEIGDADNWDMILPPDAVDIFKQLSFDSLKPIRLMKLEHQVAQKIHGLTEPDSSRAHDLIDLQIIFNNSNVDLTFTRQICERLFKNRKMQNWPPLVIKNSKWEYIYEDQSENVDVLNDLDSAVKWANNLIQKINNS